jgi:hypothetical protein
LTCAKASDSKQQHDEQKPAPKAGRALTIKKHFKEIHGKLNSGTKLVGRFEFDGDAIFANPDFLRAAVSLDAAGRVIARNDAAILTMPDILELVYFCFA